MRLTRNNPLIGNVAVPNHLGDGDKISANLSEKEKEIMRSTEVSGLGSASFRVEPVTEGLKNKRPRDRQRQMSLRRTQSHWNPVTACSARWSM